LRVTRTYNKKQAWDTLNFYDQETEVGILYADLSSVSIQGHVYLFGISSFQKGFGTKMIHYLRDTLHVKTLEGDADPDSIGFWNTFPHISWDEDSFTLVLKD